MEQSKCKPKAFTVFLDTYEHLQLLDMKQRGELFTALYEYAIYDKQIESDSGKVRMAFSFLRAQLDRDFKKYEATCERNRTNANSRKQSSRSQSQPVDSSCTQYKEKNKNKKENEKEYEDENENSVASSAWWE